MNLATVGTTLASEGLLNHGSELWFSFLYHTPAGEDERFALAIGDNGFNSNGNLVTSTSQGVGVGHASNNVLYAKVWSDNQWGGNNLSNTPDNFVSGTMTLALDTMYLIVGHVEWGADGVSNDRVTVYLPGTDLLALGAAVSVSEGIVSQEDGTFDTLRMIDRNRSNNNESFIDEIRFGATMFDVGIISSTTPVPEPSSLALVALGGLLTALRRRR